MTITCFVATLFLTGALAPALPKTTNTPTTLPDTSDVGLDFDQAFELAHQALQDQKNLAEATLPESMSYLFDQQARNLRTTEELLAINDHQHEDDLHRAVTLAKASTKWQAATLGLDGVEPVPLDGHSIPSPALLDLADRHGVEPLADQIEQIESLDDLDEPLRTELARFIDAFLALDTAARLAYQDADLSILEDLHDPNEQQEIPGDPKLLESDLTHEAPLKDAGVDFSLVLSTRNQFLDAILSLHDAIQGGRVPASGHECTEADLYPAFAISIGPCDNTYTSDAAFILDTGGNNRYHNNAGGSNLAGGSCDLVSPRVYASAALVDLGSGNNEYGDADNPRECGANGGGYLGVGFLLDAGGGDAYTADNYGTNGGGALGVGFLLDAGGDDAYTAGISGTNGGGVAGVGFLLDAGGNDTYTADRWGTNGGGYLAGTGFLLDAGGDDTYTADREGTNGGGSLGGTGFLLDAGGDDTYKAGTCATNGGGSQISGCDLGVAGVGFLLDAGGTDYYEDPLIPGGSCWDCTLIPKGLGGAQIDENMPDPSIDVGCEPLPPSPGDQVDCWVRVSDGDDEIVDEGETVPIPTVDVQVVPIVRLGDLGITATQTASLSIERGLFRASALGAFADLPIVVPLLSGEPHPDNLNHDLGVASTSYTHQADVCIEGQCEFSVGADLGDDVKVGELWEAEIQILLDGEELLSIPFVEVRVDP